MRKYACLKQPRIYDTDTAVYKIMLYETEEGVYLFEYSSPDAVFSSADRFYESLDDVYDDWNDLINERGWTGIEDPLPFCQHDAFLPVRVKGRDTGKSEWGRYEILKDGNWVEYIPE